MFRRRYMRDYDMDYLNEAKYRDIRNLTRTDITDDIKKMKGYFSRNSNPERLVNDIKDPVKLVARWIASMVIGWKEASKEFLQAVKNRRLLTAEEIDKYIEKFSNATDTGITNISEFEKRFRRYLPSLYSKIKNLVDEETTIELKTLNKCTTETAKHMMSANGRYYAIPYKIVLDNGFTTISVPFDYMTNEGGERVPHPYHYNNSLFNLKEFVNLLKSMINERF